MTVDTEFQVNTTTAGNQYQSSVTTLADGSFVIVWASDGPDGDGYGVFGQRYLADGTLIASRFQINSTTAGNQDNPSIAALADGGFMVTWNDTNGLDGDLYGIFGQRYNSDGTTSGSGVQINTYATSYQLGTEVSGLSDGGYVVSWLSVGQDGDSYGVYARVYHANGTTDSAEILVNTYTTGNQLGAQTVGLSGGGFVVVWYSTQDGSGQGIYGQRFDNAGVALGSEFLINTVTESQQFASDVAALTDGGFVATWQSFSQDGDNYGVFAQAFNSDGTARGVEFQANTYTTGGQAAPAITALADGGYVIMWTSDGQDGSSLGLYAQMYTASGAPEGQEFLINTYTTSAQRYPEAVALDGGGFVVTWSSDGQDGSSHGVYAHIYSGPDASVGDGGRNFFNGTAWDDTLRGLFGNDVLKGGDGHDVLLGGAGDDRLFGGRHRDKLLGHGGEDFLNGGRGIDRMDGGIGNDTLTGAGGRDRFIFKQNAGDDIITDFTNGEDFINLRAYGLTGIGEVVASQALSDVVIDLSAMGGSGSITLQNFTLGNLDASDFIF